MNLLLLTIAFRAWSGSALSVFLRLMAAIGVFSLEVQLVTALHLGTFRSLRLLNVLLAAGGALWAAHRSRQPQSGSPAADTAPSVQSVATAWSGARLPPSAALAVLALVILALATLRPVMGADPYHLHRVDQITRYGTLAFDPAALDVKINAMAGVYELLLADLRIPGMSTALVRLHGLLGLGFYVLAVAVVAGWVPLRRRWLLMTVLVVPVVFHQLVLVKNDLFGAVPAFVALAWVVTRGREMSLAEAGCAAALAGFAVGIKLSSAPVALVVAGFLVFDHRCGWRVSVAALLAGLTGAVAGGLLFTLVQNQLVYGGALQPYTSLGNRNQAAGQALTGIARFSVSLVDLGMVTPWVWPGRGGWGSTFGLPMIWSLVVLARCWRECLARRALIASGLCFLVFAASYPDADVAHRMVIGPGLLLIAVAIGCVDGDGKVAVAMRRSLVPVLVLSALQIGRSALLYASQR